MYLKFALLISIILPFSFGCSSTNKKASANNAQLSIKKNNQHVFISNPNTKKNRTVSSTTSNRHFIFYDSWASIRDTIDEFTMSLGYQLDFLEPNLEAELYEKYQSKANAILNAYYELYPELRKKTKNKELPVILFQSDQKPSFVLTYQDAPNTYFVAINVSFNNSDEAISMSFAHEMAHLFLQRTSTKTRKVRPKEHYYNISQVDLSKPLDTQIKLNRYTEKKMALWHSYLNTAGEVSSSNFLGTGYTYNISDNQFLNAIYIYALKKTGCVDYQNYYDLYNSTMLSFTKSGGIDNLNKSLQPSDRALITKPIRLYQDKLRACLGTSKASLYEIMSDFYQSQPDYELPESKEQYESSMLKTAKDKSFQKEVINNFDTKNLFEAFTHSVAAARLKMREIEKDPKLDFHNIRKYNHEVHADESAAQILDLLDIPFENIYISLGERNQASFKVCKEIPTAEPFSPINMNHPTQCWRIWRASKIKN